MKISKELFIAVRGSFNKEIFELILKGNSIEINSFFFECKEWAYNTIEKEIDRYYYPVKINTKNINITSGKCKTEVITYNRLLNANISGDYYCRISVFDNSGQYKSFFADAEVEATIKACEYILREINEKQLRH